MPARKPDPRSATSACLLKNSSRTRATSKSRCSVIGMATSGAVKPLAVTSSYRLAQLPHLPTLSETILPGFHVASWNMLFAPRGLPDNVRSVLSSALVEAVNDPQFRERMEKIGVSPVGKPIIAVGHFRHHASMTEQSAVADLKPPCTSGCFVLGSQGKITRP